MQLWQMDIVGGVMLVDPVTGEFAGADTSSTQVGSLITDLRFSSTFAQVPSPAKGRGGIMICRAAAPGLPRHDQLPGVPTPPAPPADERPRQGHRDPRPPAPTAGPTASGRQADPHRQRPCHPRRPAPPPPQRQTAAPSAADPPRDHLAPFPGLLDAILADAGIEVVLSGVQMPRMNSLMERWVQTCRRELLDRTLVWNHRHLLHVLREFEQFYNAHRPHQGIANARPLHALPTPIDDPEQISRLDIRRHDRLGGILHEYQHAA